MQTTISKSVQLNGIGLHSGCNVTMSILPAPANTGIVFRRVDLPNKPEIKALYSNVVNTQNCTCLGDAEGNLVSTIEHVMAALYVKGIDNALIEVNNQELPIMDGSGKMFFEALKEVELKDLSAPRMYLKVKKEVSFTDKNGNTGSITDYLQYGPNNEIYLPKNQGIAFYVQLNEGVGAADAALQVGAKAPNSNAASMIFNDGGVSQIIGTATEMYYSVDLTKITSDSDGKYLVVIANTSDNLLALTNLKTKGVTLTADINSVILEDIVATDLFEEEVNEGLEIYSATSLSFVKGGSDATVYVTTDQNAAGIAVFDEDGNQMKITKMSRSGIFGQSIWTVKFTTNKVSKLSRVAYQVKSYDDQGCLSADSNRIVVTVRK